MNTSELITEIDTEIDRLTRVRKLLLTGASIQTRKKRKEKHHLSAAGRARISAAQTKRWAKQKRASKG